MKNLQTSAASVIFVAIVSICSCSRVSRDVSNKIFLYDAANLANLHNGFHSKIGQVDVLTTETDDQREISITLHDKEVDAQKIKIFQSKELTSPDLKSGKYEVLFLRSALLVSDPVTGRCVEFVVKNEEFKDLKDKLPKSYFDADAAEVIGIAVYGKHQVSRL